MGNNIKRIRTFLSFLILYSGMAATVVAEPPVHITFNDLNKHHTFEGKAVEIKGFLYKGNEGMILSNEPNLKTCCVGSKNKRNKQILILGELLLTDLHFPVTVTGIFYTKDENESEEIFSYYFLEQAAVVTREESNGYSYYLILASGLLLGSLVLINRFKR
jgi:hypothetical protein